MYDDAALTLEALRAGLRFHKRCECCIGLDSHLAKALQMPGSKVSSLYPQHRITRYFAAMYNVVLMLSKILDLFVILMLRDVNGYKVSPLDGITLWPYFPTEVS